MHPGRPSETAARIAVNAVAAALDPELRLLLADPEEPYSRWFAEEHSPQARQQIALWRQGASVMRKLSDAIEPGGALFVLARKLWIEERARRALEQGLTQMAVMGAGYDPLALRLARAFPAASLWELDHPDTQAVKRRALEKHEGLPASLSLLPADLAREPPDVVLAGAGWDARRPAVALAEGVVMYLDEAQLGALLASLARALAPGSRLLLTMMDARKLRDAGGATARTAMLLKASGEPLRSSIDPGEVPAFLSSQGFRALEVADAAALKAAYLDPRGIARPLSEGEFLVAAERA
ncbi:MAG TPA: SAM-dependent methyltransferase [Vicinamibacteria bacterium]|nr:SAM-dependent methyltransferase [Vicinamibacteria bacterium]